MKKFMSYSEIVTQLQGDKPKAIKMIIELSIEQQQALEKIKEAEKLLDRAHIDFNYTKSSINYICKHLQIEPHFIIKEGNKVYQITPEYKAHISIIDYDI